MLNKAICKGKKLNKYNKQKLVPTQLVQRRSLYKKIANTLKMLTTFSTAPPLMSDIG